MKKKFLALILSINLIPTPIFSYANDNKNDTIVNETLVEKDFEKSELNITEANVTELKEALDFYKHYNYYSSPIYIWLLINSGYFTIFSFASYLVPIHPIIKKIDNHIIPGGN